MKAFMDKDFMLETEVAQKLYHEYAAKMPIIDYHCHLNPKEICEDRHFKNITTQMIPDLVVLSYNELDTMVEVFSDGVISI